MRETNLIVTIALLTALAGCADMGPSTWRGPKQEVPITPPSEEADGTHDQPAPHAPQSAAGQDDPAPEVAYARDDADNAPVQQTTPSSEPQPMPVPPGWYTYTTFPFCMHRCAPLGDITICPSVVQ